jgi:hypothetical protein
MGTWSLLYTAVAVKNREQMSIASMAFTVLLVSTQGLSLGFKKSIADVRRCLSLWRCPIGQVNMAIVTVQLVSLLYAGNCRSQRSIQELLSCGSGESLVSIVFYTVLFLINVVFGARATKFLVDTSQALHELVFYIDAHHCHVDLVQRRDRTSPSDAPASFDLRLNAHDLCIGEPEARDLEDRSGVSAAGHNVRVKFLRGLADCVQRDPGPSLFDLVRISPNALLAMLVYAIATGLSLFYKQVFHTT